MEWEGNESHPTIRSPTENESGQQLNLWLYVADLNQSIAGYQASKQTKFDVMSAVTDQLNWDQDLTPKERSQSFELYMAEINLVEARMWVLGQLRNDLVEI